MVNAESIKKWLIRATLRIFKAVIKGFLWFLLLYAVPMFILSIGRIPSDLLPECNRLLGMFAAVTVFFVAVAELLSKTIFQHAFNMAKTLVLMVLFVYALNGGFLTANFGTVHVMVDLRVCLAMLLIISFLGLTKSALQTINFLSERTETSQPLKQE